MEPIISHPDIVQNFKNKIKKQGIDTLHILSDFDRTLTYGTVNGQKTPSLISLLRDGWHLTPGYDQKAHALFNTYAPFENDPTLSLSERKQKMEQWWNRHNQLLIESKLSKNDLLDIIKSPHLKFRQGVPRFLAFLNQWQIPLVIFSASGCGEAIPLFFKHHLVDFQNIYYVINRFTWDAAGQAISPQKIIIHSLNKDETALVNFPEIYTAVKDKKNVLQLGDSLGDLDMVTGFDYDNLLNIGFLNFDYNENMEIYKQKFDVVVPNDGDFNFINDFLKSLS